MGLQHRQPLTSSRLALLCLGYFEVGLFLDTFTTVWIVALVGTSAEANPLARVFLHYQTLPWIVLNIVAMLSVPAIATRWNKNGWPHLSIILIGAGILGAVRMTTGTSNVVQLLEHYLS